MTCLILPNTSHIKDTLHILSLTKIVYFLKLLNPPMFPPPTQLLDLIQEQPAAAHISLMVINLWPCAPEPPWGWESWDSCVSLYPHPKWWLSSSNYQEGKISQRDNILQWGPKTGWAILCSLLLHLSGQSEVSTNPPKSINTQVCVTCELCLRLCKPGSLG